VEIKQDSDNVRLSGEYVQLDVATALEINDSVSHIETWDLHQICPTAPPRDSPGLLELDGGN
jgi:hypothetical protein